MEAIPADSLVTLQYYQDNEFETKLKGSLSRGLE